jgi:hypothetical protein
MIDSISSLSGKPGDLHILSTSRLQLLGIRSRFCWSSSELAIPRPSKSHSQSTDFSLSPRAGTPHPPLVTTSSAQKEIVSTSIGRCELSDNRNSGGH